MRRLRDLTDRIARHLDDMEYDAVSNAAYMEATVPGGKAPAGETGGGQYPASREGSRAGSPVEWPSARERFATVAAVGEMRDLSFGYRVEMPDRLPGGCIFSGDGAVSRRRTEPVPAALPWRPVFHVSRVPVLDPPARRSLVANLVATGMGTSPARTGAVRVPPRYSGEDRGLPLRGRDKPKGSSHPGGDDPAWTWWGEDGDRSPGQRRGTTFCSWGSSLTAGGEG